MTSKTDPEHNLSSLEAVPSAPGEVLNSSEEESDAVFGAANAGGPKYRSVGWKRTVVLMMKTQIGLGVLAIPHTFDTLGMVPGVICLCVVAALNAWSNYRVGAFKLRHQDVYGIDDVGRIIFGRVGREILAVAFCLYEIFVCGSAILSTSIGLNAVSTHGACTAIFVATMAIAAWIFASIRTLGKLSWLVWIGLTCVIVAVLVVTIAAGIQDRPALAPQTGPWVPDYKIVASPSFRDAISSVSSLIFAYAGTPTYFPIAAEMRDQKEFLRALVVAQTGTTLLYVVIGIVVYYYCGSYVASPALGSAGPLIKKIAYGIALPGLLVTAILIGHMPAKYVFVRLLRGTKHLNSNSVTHWVTWLCCTSGSVIIAYIIASAIPDFGSLISLVGALLGTLMSYQPMGCMWLYDNWKEPRNLVWRLKAAFSVFMIVAGTFLMIAGTWASVLSIMDAYDQPTGGSWSCSDNSNST
ncbi:hypothetical protein KC331_g110 [Hortaea werneckii]|uniref:Amino acid transporter transmembrane domain-containing protein n=1 Tax=Hortaea werneckii TaxID=91943 RepID=A0A3M7DDS3_HORWE|nr:hypothetical protein KC331_g110 [Hortaea werneckii]KAI7722864.1 hypothetical protein KC353_g136 [Hortaea werneckii]RMY62283.1 hypothetical protein D0865_00537 [Hortaea werneckii]